MHFVMQEASNFQTPTKMAGKAVENKGLSKEGTITELTPAEQHCYVRWKGSDQPSRSGGSGFTPAGENQASPLAWLPVRSSCHEKT